MTCYIRHLAHMITEAGLEDTKDARKALDSVIRSEMRMEGAKCNEVWAEVKKNLSDLSWKERIQAALRDGA